MSLDAEISLLTSTASSLIDTFNKKNASIESRVQAALASAPQLKRTYHINQVNGNDSNVGNAESPLKTFDEAILRTPYGGRVEIIMYSDYRFSSPVKAGGISMYIRPYQNGLSRKLRVYFDAKSEEGELRVGGLNATDSMEVHFNNIDIFMPDTTNVSGTIGAHSSCLGPRYSGDATLFTLKFSYCTIATPANTTFLIAQSPSAIILQVAITTVSASMSGRWVQAVSAGITPESLDYIIAKGITEL